jgi:hypothetical protein
MEMETEAEAAAAVMTGTAENGDNGDGSGRNGADWEIEQTKGMGGEETVSATVALGMGVTAESI